MASPNEIKVLRIVRELGESTKRAVAKELRVSEDYARHLLECLEWKGFLEKSSGRYTITEKGIDELLGTLYHILGILNAKIYRASQQEERIIKRINQLKQEKTKVIA